MGRYRFISGVNPFYNIFLGVSFIILLFGILSGCSMAQIRQELSGMTAADVTNAPKLYARKFDIGREAAFNKILEILKGMQATIVKKDTKNFMIGAVRFDSAFHSCIGTTEVGIVVRPAGGTSTEVLVASGNYNLAEYVSQEIFLKLK